MCSRKRLYISLPQLYSSVKHFSSPRLSSYARKIAPQLTKRTEMMCCCLNSHFLCCVMAKGQKASQHLLMCGENLFPKFGFEHKPSVTDRK